MAASLPVSFLSQTLLSSCVFILVVDLLDTQLKCPFNSANCHHACLMNKVFHGQNPVYYFLPKGMWHKQEAIEEVLSEVRNRDRGEEGFEKGDRETDTETEGEE